MAFWYPSWFPPDATSWTTATALVVATCTCGTAEPPGFACVADPHATPLDRETWEALKALERRAEFRFFVGHPPTPRAALPHPRRDQRAHRRRSEEWRTRALGKRPTTRASG